MEKCLICVLNSRFNFKELLVEIEILLCLWFIIFVDLFDYKGFLYLFCVDYFLKWLEFVKFEN